MIFVGKSFRFVVLLGKYGYCLFFFRYRFVCVVIILMLEGELSIEVFSIYLRSIVVGEFDS